MNWRRVEPDKPPAYRTHEREAYYEAMREQEREAAYYEAMREQEREAYYEAMREEEAESFRAVERQTARRHADAALSYGTAWSLARRHGLDVEPPAERGGPYRVLFPDMSFVDAHPGSFRVCSPPDSSMSGPPVGQVSPGGPGTSPWLVRVVEAAAKAWRRGVDR